MKPITTTLSATPYVVPTNNFDQTLFVQVADCVITLPAASPTLKGMKVRAVVDTLSTVTGCSLSPDANDKIQGNGLTAADDKDAINTAATDAAGDFLELVCDGVDGWIITDVRGTWARQA